MDAEKIEGLAGQLEEAAAWLRENATVIAEFGSVGGVNIGVNLSAPYIFNNEGDVDEEPTREQAVARLATMARRMARFGEGEVEKSSGEYTYRLRTFATEGWPRVTLETTMAVDAVCKVVQHDDLVEVVETIYPDPIHVKKLVPRTEKICPPSLLAGLSVDA